jgi:hypothetical protein
MSDLKSPHGPASDPPLDSPPPYSAAHTGAESSRSPAPRAPGRVPGLLDLPFDQYTPASASVSSDGLTLSVANPVLSSNPTALASFLRAQVVLPPFLTMRVQGVSWRRYPADFDVSLNLMPYILKAPAAGATSSAGGNQSGNQTSSYVQLNVQGLPSDTQGKFRKKELTLQSLAQAFCSDRLTNKRCVSGLVSRNGHTDPSTVLP